MLHGWIRPMDVKFHGIGANRGKPALGGSLVSKHLRLAVIERAPKLALGWKRGRFQREGVTQEPPDLLTIVGRWIFT